jgi:hypothetical protein
VSSTRNADRAFLRKIKFGHLTVFCWAKVLKSRNRLVSLVRTFSALLADSMTNNTQTCLTYIRANVTNNETVLAARYKIDIELRYDLLSLCI